MSTILCAHTAYFKKYLQTHFLCLLHQTLRISSAAKVINSPVTKRHRSQQRYESLGWLNNRRKRNRVYNTLRPYRILQKIPPNSFSVSVASKASYIIGGEGYKLARDEAINAHNSDEATPLTTALRVVGMVKQPQENAIVSTILCAHTAYFKKYLQTHFLWSFASKASYIIDGERL